MATQDISTDRDVYDILVSRGVVLPPMTRDVTIKISMDNVVTVTYECIAPKEVVDVAIDAIAANLKKELV